MKCILSLAVLAIGQIRLIAATVPASTEAQQQPNDASLAPKEIKYLDIIPTAEKRVKVVMGLMEGTGFKATVLTSVQTAVGKVSNDIFEKWTKVLSEEYEKRFESEVLKSKVPSWLQAQGVKVSSDQASKVHTALTEAGKSVHTLLTHLFGNYAEKIKAKNPAAAAVQASGATGVQPEGSLTQAAAEESTTDVDLLNLRFVLPGFANDFGGLYGLVKDLPTGNEDQKKAVLDVVTKWLTEKVPSVEAKADLNAEQIQAELKKLFNTEPHLRDSIIAVDAFNQLDENLTDSIQECKKMNSASFGTIGLLLAAVLAFTMW